MNILCRFCPQQPNFLKVYCMVSASEGLKVRQSVFFDVGTRRHTP